jgi:hypothetical protein
MDEFRVELFPQSDENVFAFCNWYRLLRVQIYLQKEDFIEWSLTSAAAMLSQYDNRSTPRIHLIFVLVILSNQFECLI